MTRYNLENKLAIITGGAGFLGIEHAKALIEADAKVVLLDVNSKKLNKMKNYFSMLNKEVHYFKTDITKERSVKNTLNLIKKKFKKIDILINNAAIDYIPTKKKIKPSRFVKYSIEHWKRDIDVQLTGAFICCKIIGGEIAKEGGVILNIASDLSLIAPQQSLYSHLKSIKPPSYSVAKHGIVGLSKYLASYWADSNVRVNTLSPGGVFNSQDKVFIKKIKKLIPMKRMANVNEYKEAVQFLCSDASSYMTGHNMVIDGGRSII